MPKPRKGETQQAFISRCMAYPDMQKYDQKQRAAICYSYWRGESMHPDFERILTKFLRRFKREEAIAKFVRFVKNNGLDVLKAYNPKIQFQESFEWITPLIQFYKQDAEAKYYLVSALTADISMNNTDYGPEDRLAREDSSMNWRPVNLDHDHSKWLPYPRTRVDFSAMNEFTLEATLRVDNKDRYFQRQLDHDPMIPEEDWINHPSIEGRPHPIEGRYHFTAMAFLRKGYELPGEPLSDIVPLAFNESVGKSLCEFKDGELVCSTTSKEVKEMVKIENKPILENPEQTGPEKDNQPKVAPECPTGFHHDGTQCVPDESGDSAKTAMTKQTTPGGTPKPVLSEQEVPDINPPDEVNKQSTATCPPNHHMENGKCVPDVAEKCEKGWHFDEALEKCVPDNPQVNEMTESQMRLRIAELDLENIRLNEQITELKEELDALKTQKKRKDADNSKRVEKLTQDNYKKDGVISEAEKRIDSLEAKDKRNVEQITELAKREQKALGTAEEAFASRDSYKKMHADERKSREETLAENEKLSAKNLELTNQLTEAKSREIQWTKDKKKLEESVDKMKKHQKYLYKEIEKAGYVFVDSKAKP